MANTSGPTTLLHNRLLHDIKEIASKPYPGIDLHVHDSDALTHACLILTPEGEAPIHLTIVFGQNYPLSPPKVKIQSRISHPNVYGQDICINILRNGAAGLYTPAYTLKGICIQLLSFFASDTIEQEDGAPGYVIDRKKSQGERNALRPVETDDFVCDQCRFGTWDAGLTDGRNEEMDEVAQESQCVIALTESDGTAVRSNQMKINQKEWRGLKDLPNEILLIVCDYLEEDSLFLAAKAWKVFSVLIREYNIVQNRELKCFTLKQGYQELELGIGVHVERRGAMQSEFDIISRRAYEELHIRTSVQGLLFEHWLPLPLSAKHWQKVRRYVDDWLTIIQDQAQCHAAPENVIFAFMNEVVVLLSTEAHKYQRSEQEKKAHHMGIEAPKSSLKHASEKAMESYFHLFHLLLCLATERPKVIRNARSLIQNFLAGSRTEADCPNLGYLLVVILISDIEVTEDFTKAIIREAITRNVVWMLDGKGSGMAELSFMEASAVSAYRLQKTFDAGLTSYRLLMFLNLMRRVVKSTRVKTDPKSGEAPEMTLVELRDSLFASHGAPPYGTAAKLAAKVREIQEVKSFPEFLVNMGLRPPSPSVFTKFLRDTVQDSMEQGYSRWALTQGEALEIRLRKEGPNVERPQGVEPAILGGRRPTFFPNDRGGRGRGGGFGR